MTGATKIVGTGNNQNTVPCFEERKKGEFLDYSMTILHGTVLPDPPNPNFLNLPYRTFVWVGGSYPVDLKLSDGKPDPKAGKPEWCFSYGEREWVKPDKFLDESGEQFNGTYIDYKKRATIDDLFKIPCGQML